jgi:ribosomal protein S18 acetylase RimI-like enzyme
VRADAWLAERLGRPAFTLGDGDEPRAPGFYQARVDCADLGRLHALEAAGFRVVDVNVTLRREPGPIAASSAVQVATAEPSQRTAVLEIATRDYGVSRFHMDPEIPDATAATIKRDWAEAVLDGRRGERMLVAVAADRVVGFLAVLAAPAARTIDLLAVRTDARRTGAGRALVAALLAGTDRPVQTGTQVANVAAVAFYERLGFETVASQYVLHLHRA